MNEIINCPGVPKRSTTAERQKGFFILMTDQEIIIHNEKRNFKNMMGAFKYIEGLKFDTPIGQELHADMVECIAVIKSEIIKKANNLIEK